MVKTERLVIRRTTCVDSRFQVINRQRNIVLGPQTFLATYHFIEPGYVAYPEKGMFLSVLSLKSFFFEMKLVQAIGLPI